MFHSGKILESSYSDYIEYESDDDTLSKTLSLTAYLDGIKQHLASIIKELKSTRSSWKMNCILDLYYYSEKHDVATEKEMTI